MTELIITIDGPAGVGKSSVAQLLAKALGAGFLDTGAMYRAVTVAAMGAKVDLSGAEQLLDVLRNHDFQFSAEGVQMRVAVDGIDVTERIRLPEVTANVRYIASIPDIRRELVEMQRSFATRHKKIVTEGRDQGTVAFPNADYKFFLTAQPSERARRRQNQLGQEGASMSVEQIQKAIEKRDVSDQSRTAGPLTPAKDAIIIDTTDLNLEQVVAKMLEYIKNK